MRKASEMLKTRKLKIRYLNHLSENEEIPGYKLLEGNFDISGYIRYSLSDKQKEVFDKLESKEEKLNFIFNEVGFGFGGTYTDEDTGDKLHFICSYQVGWFHLSVSMPDKDPSWVQMCKMKDIFFDDEEECVEYHPKKSEYINKHPHCLHIWRRNFKDSLKPYMNAGLITEGKEITVEDLFKGNTEALKVASSISLAEGGNALIDQKIKLYDNVPAELLFNEIAPPSYMVGMKTQAGYDKLKEVANERGIKVGLGDL